jgi:hypothetical protein
MPGEAPFNAHVELLALFLSHRKAIVDNIQGVLNAQRKPVQYLQDRPLLYLQIEDCFYTQAAVTDQQARLRGQLDRAHRSSGFSPRQIQELFNDLINPAEMMIRAFHCWRQTRWPGRSGRVRYAHTLFNLYLLRCLELLSMRVFDAGSGGAGDRLAEVQALLDELWRSAPADQPALVRDARWLIPFAQSPTTDDLAAYFEVAEFVGKTLEESDRVEIQRAHVLMIGGHLRSQMRHYCVQDRVPISDNSVVQRTRTSNALDFALLIQCLVTLLDAYEHVIEAGDTETRRVLASAICQGISADPDLFLNRIDLLGPYSMIEHLFITPDEDGQIDYTAMGRRHLQFIEKYQALIGRLFKPLSDDYLQFRPIDGAYSPYGAIFGTPTNLMEDMALKTLQLDVVTRFGLEDVFADGGADKLDWVNGWRDLPHVDRQVQKLYEYPQQFASDIFDRIDAAMREGVLDDKATVDTRTGDLYILNDDDEQGDAKAALVPDLPVRYIGSSDQQIVAAQKAVYYDQAQLLRHRLEGYFVLSYQTPGGWVGIKKDCLTEVLGAGQNAKISGLPPAAAAALRLMVPNLLQASVPPSIFKA